MLKTGLENIKIEQRSEIEAYIKSTLEAAQEMATLDLWEQPELTMTYWVLLIALFTNLLEEIVNPDLRK